MVAFLAFFANTARSAEANEWLQAQIEPLLALYQHFHTNPELSFQEQATSKRLADELRAAGVTVHEGIGGYGVVGILENGATPEGPTLLIRSDLDALPVTELTDLPFASKVRMKTEAGVETGVMHACGHDIHITTLIGVARYLVANKEHWKGRVMLIGQPAEERVAGAKAMLKEGLYEKFGKPAWAVALHVDSQLPTGSVSLVGGPAMANVDSVDIVVKGKGGHGAYPHTTVDPIVTAAHLVVSLQSIVSREIKPIEPAVVTVGSIHGGSKHNIIPSECRLQLTVRSYSDSVRKQLLSSIERRAKAAAMAAGAPEPEVTFSEPSPAVINDEELSQRIRSILTKALSEQKVKVADRSMGAEDFGQFGAGGVPTVMYSLGTIDPERLRRFESLGVTPPSLHSPQYYPDARETIETGVKTMTAVVLDLLPAK